MRPAERVGRRSTVAAGRRVGLPLAAIALLSLGGCERGAPIPEGAQQVHIVVNSDTTVSLVPSTVRAGDVYLVLDSPEDGSIAIVSQQRTAEATPGPFTDDGALARVAAGDTEGTSMSGFEAGGCSPEQNREDRGKTGPCGNVMQMTVAPGKYAFFGGNPEESEAPMAVLQVVP